MNLKSMFFLIAGFFLGSLFTIGCGGGGGGGTYTKPATYSASDLIFNNQACTLTANNVQTAIDELLIKQQTAEATQGAEAMVTTTSTLTGAINELVARAAQLEAKLAALEAKTAPLTTSGTNVYFTGVNVHIRNNKGSSESRNGTGNLVIGYDESYYGESSPTPHNLGSHCLIIGTIHLYPYHLCIAVGRRHVFNENCGYALAGHFHILHGGHGTICGGQGHYVGGTFSSVSGGSSNTAIDLCSVVSGSANKGASNGDHTY